MRTPKLRLILFSSFLVLASPALAQMAESIPTSNNLVTFSIDLPPGLNNDQPVQITVREGGLARVELNHGSQVFGFVPHLVEGSSEHLIIEVFEIEERAPGKEAIRFVEKLETQTGLAATPQKAAAPRGLQLVVTDVKLRPSRE